MKISIPEYFFSEIHAKEYVCKMLNEIYGITLAVENISGIFNDGKNQINLDNETENVIKNGKCKLLQQFYDDEIDIAPPISFGISTDVAGLKFKLQSNINGKLITMNDEGIIESPEDSFSNDIVFFRKSMVDEYNKQNLLGMERAYRSLLFSSISLVESIMNRYVQFSTKKKASEKTIDEKSIESPAALELRVKSYIRIICPQEIDNIIHSKEWDSFGKIRNERNKIVHPSDVAMVYKVYNMICIANKVKDIGKMFSNVRKLGGKKQYIGFLNMISNLPVINIE